MLCLRMHAVCVNSWWAAVCTPFRQFCYSILSRLDSSIPYFANAPRHHIFPPFTTIDELLLNSLLFKVGAAKITAMLRQDGLICETEVFLSSGEVGLCKPNRRKGEDPVWFVITPVYPETKLPMTDQACCSELISAICTQLEEFGAMTFETVQRHSGGWVKEAKSNGRAIIAGKAARRRAKEGKGRPSAKGKFWELHTTATKPPGVTLVDMVMYEELTEKKLEMTHILSAKETKPKEGPIDRKPTLTI